MAAASVHIPVLSEESISLLDVHPGGTYVDGTVGLGGHASRILARLAGRGRLIGLDRDSDALVQANERLSSGSESVLQLFQEDYRNLPFLLQKLNINSVDGFLFDLGVSSYQLDAPGRGFSFRCDGPLDMRMDQRQEETAADLVNHLSQKELQRILKEYGEEPSARRLADAIVERRRSQPFERTLELAQLAQRVKGGRKGRLHPATQLFQALRIAVNSELKGLGELLEKAAHLLSPGGRLVVISFHSLEDRIVKRTLRKLAGKCVCGMPADFCRCPRREVIEILTRKPITPSESETAKNPRARSAKLRAARRSQTSRQESAGRQGATSDPKTTRQKQTHYNNDKSRLPFSRRPRRTSAPAHALRLVSALWDFADRIGTRSAATPRLARSY